jgi:RsiW-degrading membrane proteinase PrsW (M82 family)
MNRRPVGRAVAAAAALAAFAWAGWAAHSSAIPELRIYDGYRMIFGATLVVTAVAPFIWRWRRDRSLVVIAVAAAVGSTVPLVISAVRQHVPIVARLRGSWALAGADLVGPALVVGFVGLWLAVREWTPRGAGAPDGGRGQT